MRQIRIPGLLTMVRVHHSADIRAAADSRSFDRPRGGHGPLLNRMIGRRFEKTLRTPNKPLSSARLQNDEERIATNRALASRFNDDTATALADLQKEIDAAARFVVGNDDTDPGPLAQTLFGRLFASDFSGTADTWSAAQTLAASVSSANPLRGVIDALTGRVRSGQALLSTALGDDPSAVHAVGIAAANIAETLKAQRELFVRSGPTLSAEAALTKTLHAPERVARQTHRLVETPLGTLKAGTLVVLETRQANATNFDRRVSFLSEAWSACPASAIVIAMTKAIWTRACDIRGGTAEVSPAQAAVREEAGA